MVFSSYIFILCFLPVFIIGYYFIGKFSKKYTAALVYIIIMSMIFYGYSNIRFLLILLASILLNWKVSRLFYRDYISSNGRKALLCGGICASILLIFYFKYYNFFAENINFLFSESLAIRDIILPLGISFYTFQQISFIVDSYHDETKDYKFLEYFGYVIFFPQLVAGPVVLHDEIIPQFRNTKIRDLDFDNLSAGIQMFTFGLFKKAVLADTLGSGVTWTFSSLPSASSGDFIVTALCYTFQIYFDFSGYSDMAAGIAKMINIQLPLNFNSPYISYSITEFWKRWHITLTRFLTKYVYYPLGGNRCSRIKTYRNILTVFLLSGLWHGADWTFIIWGGLNGLAVIIERMSFKIKNDENRACPLRWLWTFLTVNIFWLLFRSDTLTQWTYILKRMLKFDNHSHGMINLTLLRI